MIPMFITVLQHLYFPPSRNGDTYIGEYFADRMHGYGAYEFSNGHRYEGAWHEGRKQGLGIYTFRNGETRAGHWHMGAREIRSSASGGGGGGGGGVAGGGSSSGGDGSSSPSSPRTVNHSKVLHAVQVRCAFVCRSRRFRLVSSVW